ncbi:MAG: CHASE2 domain-containing serine/threonine-protein kinase [Acidiferrobacterales bacterium]
MLKRDWFIALLISLVFAAATLFRVPFLHPFLQNMERLAYDTGVKWTQRDLAATEKIAIVAIDDESIGEIGRWPWPRNILAQMIAWLSEAETKVIGLQIFLTEPQTDPGLMHFRELRDYMASATFPSEAQPQVDAIMQLINRAEQDLDADNKLAQTIPVAGNVFMPMFFNLQQPLGNPDAALPDFILRNRLTKVITRPDLSGTPAETDGVTYPLKGFGAHTAGIGHLNLSPDPDGGIRKEALVLKHYDDYYPSLALLLAARSLNLKLEDITVYLGERVKLGRLEIDTDPAMQMYTGFYSASEGKSPFATYSFYDVRAGNIPASSFKDKIVLIGSTAVGVGNTYVTPLSVMSAAELSANVIASIRNQDFYIQPEWTIWAQTGIFLAIALYLMFALPHLGAGIAAFLSLLVFSGLLASQQYLLVAEKTWLENVSPALLLLVGHIALTTKRFLITERLKKTAETDSAQNNRMLGLSFQGQGQLDMAMDKFRKLPVDKSVLELMYNLALDFERKRQFNKAVSAYSYILEHDQKFRDTADRRKRAQQAEHAITLGPRHMTTGGTLILEGVDQKPTLGRYEIDKELGKGAMGTVYLGRDPKINRVVAIKTLALSDEFEDDELEKAKQRFFREAETAGRLSHPNIVTIYDAGEEQDLAYIAMEYLEGKDLTHFIKSKGRLPLEFVMNLTARVADALDYAHKQDVVHRDIKPANIMYNEKERSVKVTDFGIARITASSRTRTGVILGTPSYMSPEQLAARKVDGRSDLFSLGVTMYELLAAAQPFGGETMAALMYQITNTKHSDLTQRRPEVPACVRSIIDKLLEKDPDKRFQAGGELKRALLECVSSIREKR